MTDKRVVMTTCGSIDEARHIAHALVERRLAACVNLVPQVESTYRWKGEVETVTEVMLIIKTTADAFDCARRWLSCTRLKYRSASSSRSQTEPRLIWTGLGRR
jgi:uncharacterized protein involved in tolerance to divalent cations